MTELDLAIVKLYKLHKNRIVMSFNSIYHGVYVEMAITLNKKIKDLSGRNYADFRLSEIEEIIKRDSNTGGEHGKI